MLVRTGLPTWHRALLPCDVDGNCLPLGATEPQQAVHCQSGFYGADCDRSCGTACRTNACTVGGNCLGYDKNPNNSDPATHCIDGFYWGDCSRQCVVDVPSQWNWRACKLKACLNNGVMAMQVVADDRAESNSLSRDSTS